MDYKWPDYVNNFSEFNENEAELLDQHFSFYWALYNEEREAKTDLQKQFIDNCSNGTPKTRHEYAFYKFLKGSGNVNASIEENDEPIKDREFIEKLRSVIKEVGLLEFYTNNHWCDYVESRYDFTTDEAYILDQESGYLAAIYDEVIEAPDESSKLLVENCYNENPATEREKAFFKFLDHATFPESENTTEPAEPTNTEEKSEVRSAPKQTKGKEIEPEVVRTGDTHVPTQASEPVKVKNPNFTPSPVTRTAATTNEILGGNNGKPKQYYEQEVGGDSFGNRASWKRMRGSNRKYGKYRK